MRTGAPAASAPIVADGTPCAADNAAGTGTSPFSCGPLTVNTSGDLITCEWGLDGSGTVLGDVSDATNGPYKVAMMSIIAGTSLDISWQGQAFFENAAAGTYSPSISFASGDGFVSLACQVWKNARSTFVLDGGSIDQAKDQFTAATNPTSGTAQAPSASGELIVGWLTNGCAATPTPGTNYSLISSVSANCEWAETWIEPAATSTNTPFTSASDVYRDQQVAYLPSSAAAGVEPLSMFIDMEGLTNGSAPTAAAMAASTRGIDINSSAWICQNTDSMLTGSTSGQLHNLLNSVWVNGTTYSGSGTLGFQVSTIAGSPTGADNCNLTIGAVNSMTVSYILETDIPQNETNGNQYSINQIGTTGGVGEQCNPFITANGSAISIKAEHHGGGSSNSIAIATNTIYFVQEQLISGTSCTIRIWDTTNTELSGSPIICSTAAAGHQCVSDFSTGTPNQFEIGITGAELESAAHHIWTDDVKLDTTGSFPLAN